MKLDRLVSILVLLLRHERMQAKELAETFEVSVRTILRDIEAINLAGIPIITYQGTNGGISIAEGYRLDRSVLSEDDMSTIISALGGIARTIPDSRHRVLMDKLRNIIPSSQLDILDIKSKQLIVDYTPWGANALMQASVAAVKKAIEDHKEMEFEYTDSVSARTSRRVEPYSLVLKAQKWYLYAWCTERQDFRLFRLSRMNGLKATERNYLPRTLPKEQPDFEEPWKSSDSAVVLELVFEKETESMLLEWFGEDVEKLPDGRLLAKVKLPENNWLYGFILSFGAGVEVVSPPHFREKMKEIAGEIIKKYS